MKALMLVPDPEQSGLTLAETLGLRVRADATATGVCACGAIRPAVRTIAGQVTLAEMHHEHDCPAVSEAVHQAARRLGTNLRMRPVEVDLPEPEAA